MKIWMKLNKSRNRRYISMKSTLFWRVLSSRRKTYILNQAVETYSRVVCHQPPCFDSWAGRASWAGIIIIIIWAVHTRSLKTSGNSTAYAGIGPRADWENGSFPCRFVSALSRRALFMSFAKLTPWLCQWLSSIVSLFLLKLACRRRQTAVTEWVVQQVRRTAACGWHLDQDSCLTWVDKGPSHISHFSTGRNRNE